MNFHRVTLAAFGLLALSWGPAAALPLTAATVVRAGTDPCRGGLWSGRLARPVGSLPGYAL